MRHWSRVSVRYLFSQFAVVLLAKRDRFVDSISCQTPNPGGTVKGDRPAPTHYGWQVSAMNPLADLDAPRASHLWCGTGSGQAAKNLVHAVPEGSCSMNDQRNKTIRRYLVSLVPALMVIGVLAGPAQADVSGANVHGPSTEATHADTNGIGATCSPSSWRASAYTEQRDYDDKSHTQALQVNDYYSGSTTTLYSGFTTSLNKLLRTSYAGSDFVSSNVQPIHSWHDLVWPRFKHYMSSGCSPP